jgi:hypothetical protein
VVVAVDRLRTNQPPPGAKAIVLGVGTQFFGSAISVDFAGLAAGTYTVQVPAVTGYLPEEDPAKPGQVLNMASALYGNPRRITVPNDTWKFTVFQFLPYLRATGTVRDAWTGAWIGDAQVSFRARNGCISNLVYNGYPNNATYKVPWATRAHGGFPTNVILPAVDWNLKLTHSSHATSTVSSAIHGLSAGQSTNLGTLWMVPMDKDGNGLADDWEDRYFPGQSPGPGDDPDHDTHTNRLEYLCGTDPTNRASVFKATAADLLSPTGFTLRWPVASGRGYEVRATEDLSAVSWPKVAGPWTAAYGQQWMQWTDTNAPAHSNRFYHIRVILP